MIDLIIVYLYLCLVYFCVKSSVNMFINFWFLKFILGNRCYGLCFLVTLFICLVILDKFFLRLDFILFIYKVRSWFRLFSFKFLGFCGFLYLLDMECILLILKIYIFSLSCSRIEWIILVKLFILFLLELSL